MKTWSGSYQGIFIEQPATLIIRPDFSIYITIYNVQRLLYHGTLLFPDNNNPLIMFERRNTLYELFIEFSPNSHTQVIGFHSKIYPRISSLKKLENSEPIHDDL